MGIYLTGRSGSVVYAGNCSGNAGQTIVFRPDIGGAYNRRTWWTEVQVNSSKWRLFGGKVGDSPVPNQSQDDTWHSFRCSVTLVGLALEGATPGTPPTYTNPEQDYTVPNSPGDPDLNISGGGSWSVTYDQVDEAVIVDETDYPSDKGPKFIDPPLYTRYTFVQLIRPRSAVTLTISFGGATATMSGFLPAGASFDQRLLLNGRDYTVSVDAQAYTDAPRSASISVDASINGVGMDISPGYVGENDYTEPDTGLTGVMRATCDSVVMAQVSASGVTPGLHTLALWSKAQAEWHASRAYHLPIFVRAMKIGYPGAVNVRVNKFGGEPADGTLVTTGSGGSTSVDYMQRQFSANGQWRVGNSDGGPAFAPYTGPTGPQAKAEFQNVRCWMENAWLNASGENPADWRISFRGWNFTGLESLTQAGTLNVETTTRTATGPAAISISYSDYSASWKGKSFAGYRYARFYLTADATGQPARITLGSKYWDVTVTTSGYVEIDLRAPTSTTAIQDAFDSKWPLEYPPPYTVSDGPLSGVSNVSGITIDHLASGHLYTLTKIDLVRKDHSRVTFLPAWDSWQPQNTKPSDEDNPPVDDYRVRFLMGDTDGRQSLEQTDFSRSHPKQGDPIYHIGTIAGMIADIQGQSGAYPTDGWSVNDRNTPPVDTNPIPALTTYLTQDLPAAFLAGGGYHVSGGALISGFDLDASAALNVPAQTLFDEIDWYPGIGDVFGIGAGGTGTVLQLAAVKVLHGGAWGVILKDDDTPNTGVRAQLTETAGGANAGSGFADARGTFYTGNPFGKGNRLHTLSALTGENPPPSAGLTIRARKWTQQSFRKAGTPAADSRISYDVSIAMRHYRAFVRAGTIRVGTANEVVPATWNDKDTGISGDYPCLRIERASRNQKLSLAWTDGSAVKVASSVDEGKNWSTAVTIAASGKHPELILEDNGFQRFFYYEGGAVKGKIYDAFGNLLEDVFTVVGTADDAEISAKPFTTGEGARHYGLFYRDGGQLQYVTSTNGKDFS